MGIFGHKNSPRAGGRASVGGRPMPMGHLTDPSWGLESGRRLDAVSLGSFES